MKKTIYPKTITGNMWKNLCVLFALVCFMGLNTSKASHMAGADLTYEYIGNNQYLVTYTLYRDCAGIDAPLTESLQVGSTVCGSGVSQSLTLNQVPGTGQEISLNCPGNPSTCAGGTAPGIQAYEYTTIVTLPAQCPDWNFSVSNCCRNAAITTLDFGSGDGQYLEAYLNNTTTNNNSPTFANYPVAFQCIGQNNFYNHGVIDSDGDSLVYFFIPPRTGANQSVTYAAGYSIANPITSSPATTINQSNGDIFMHPTQTEVGVVAVLIQEYRNGVLIGSVMRDIQIYTVACSNTLPSASGINGGGNFATSACTGGQLCFDIITNETDPGQTLTLSWNAGIPGATFTTSGSPNPVGRFCWAPTPADARPQPYTFTVTVRDDACPSNGLQTYSFSVVVSNMGLNVTSTPSVACYGNHNGSATVTATGNPPLTYLWTSPQLPNELTSQTISHLVAGTYTVNVTDGSGCVGAQTVVITQPAPLVVTTTPTNAGCGSALGSAIASVNGGTGTYDYLWNTVPPQTSSEAIDLPSGPYTVTVTDDNNCHASANVVIANTAPVSFAISSTPATCLANDGSATVTTQGGSGNFTYVWTPNVSSGPTATGLIAGIYECVATDVTSGCSQVLTTNVANAAGISATAISLMDATCPLSEDGSAIVTISGGQSPYTIEWPSGEATTVATMLNAGTNVVMVEDYLGCRAYATVEIASMSVGADVNLGNDTTLCIGDQLILDAGAGVGTTYLWSDNSTNQTLTVTGPGNYSVLVTNASGCEAFDVIAINYITCNPFSTGSVRSVANQVSVYPNPAKNELNVNVAKIRDSEVSITVMDILGNTVFFSNEVSGYGYTKSIDINALTAGVYTVKVTYNNEVNTSRIVKQ
ncbi:MAG: T9SS type A sorting domain-containing protein [Bacteroidota bacterium]